MTISIAVKSNLAEQIRAAKEADPSLTEESLATRFNVVPSRVRSALRSHSVSQNGRRTARG